MGIWVPKATLAVANDQYSASLLRDENSATREAANEVVSGQVDQQLPGKLAADPTIRATANLAASTAIETKVADLSLAEIEENQVPWDWYALHGGNREVAIGRRTDGTYYPEALNPSLADLVVRPLTTDQGWRYAVMHETREVQIGLRNDGTWYPSTFGGSGTKRTCIFGDSLTANWAPYVAALAAAIGRIVDVRGNGGRTSHWIAGRQGGQPFRVTSSTGQVPASGAVSVTVAVKPQLGSTVPTFVAGNWYGILAGIGGLLTITDETTGAATFTRAAPGRATPLPAGSQFITGEADRDSWPIIWAGRNNFKLTGDPDQVLADVKAMMAYTRHSSHALILSIPPWVGEESGTGIRGVLDATNQKLYDAFPTAFEDTAARLRSADLMAAVGVTPTSQDLADIGNGLTPTSFRLPGDPGHLNDKGYAALDLLINDIYTARGWI